MEPSIVKDCCICYEIMIEPLKLKCGHRFCAHCFKKATGINKQCPLCRAKTDGTKVDRHSIDLKYQKQLKQKFSDQFEKRYKELEEAGYLVADMIDVQFEVGNRFKLLKKFNTNKQGYENKNEWTAFVYMRPLKVDDYTFQHVSRLVSHVTFELCEGWPGKLLQKVEAKAGDREVALKRRGWGYFELPITIHFHKELKIEPMECYHMLDFDNGDYKVKTLTLSKKKVLQAFSPTAAKKLEKKEEGSVKNDRSKS